MDLKNKKILVAFFSRKGQNYSNGRIIELEKGNTATAAEMIAELTEGEIFEIRPVREYPAEYSACTMEARSELRENARPELVSDQDLTGYDVIFLGYPNWWSTMPMPVWTFLEGHDFADKIILPFCTHEGSGMGDSESDIKKLAAGAEIKKGLAIHGSGVSNAKAAIERWLKA